MKRIFKRLGATAAGALIGFLSSWYIFETSGPYAPYAGVAYLLILAAPIVTGALMGYVAGRYIFPAD